MSVKPPTEGHSFEFNQTPASGLWQRLRLWAWGLAQLLRRGRPDVAVLFIAGIGDELLCSCLLHELRQRQHRNIWLMASRPQLFAHNQDYDQLLPVDWRYLGLARRLGAKVVDPRYTYRVAADRDQPPGRHILRLMLAAAGVRGPAALRPYLQLTETERSATAWARGCIVIQSSGGGAKFTNALKEYFPERLQAVVDAFAGKENFVQLGHPQDALLRNVRDLRGRTGLRESAAILANASLFVGLEGGLMHLARAVDCRSVIVYGGRLWPEETGYICNENLVRRPPCAPCWGWTRCDFDRICMRDIPASEVIDAVRRALARHGTPLPVETADITDADILQQPTSLPAGT